MLLINKKTNPGDNLFSCTDVNPNAGIACKETFNLNNLIYSPEIVLTNLIDSLEYRLQSNVDLIVFNPPYVPTDDCEVRE